MRKFIFLLLLCFTEISNQQTFATVAKIDLFLRERKKEETTKKIFVSYSYRKNQTSFKKQWEFI